MLVLLPEVILLAEVDEVDYGFGGKEEERVNRFDLASSQQGNLAKWCAMLELYCWFLIRHGLLFMECIL